MVQQREITLFDSEPLLRIDVIVKGNGHQETNNTAEDPKEIHHLPNILREIPKCDEKSLSGIYIALCLWCSFIKKYNLLLMLLLLVVVQIIVVAFVHFYFWLDKCVGVDTMDIRMLSMEMSLIDVVHLFDCVFVAYICFWHNNHKNG